MSATTMIDTERLNTLLEAGIAVADVGCGHGHSTLLMAEALAEVFSKAGLTRFRRAAETPFNLILEARH